MPSSYLTIEIERADGEPPNPDEVRAVLAAAGFKAMSWGPGLRMTSASMLRRLAEDVGAALRLGALQAERENTEVDDGE